MHIVLGGTGHVGSALAESLLAAGNPVTVVTRDDAKSATWRARGADVAVADVRDAAALRGVLSRGKRLFILNPPADPSRDVVAEETRSVDAIIDALADSPIEKVVALSTFGAQPGDALGDLGVLWHLEQRLGELPVPATILRGAYYMTNWDHALTSARDRGVVHTFFPTDLVLPMVSPGDIGREAAARMLQPRETADLAHVEGPGRYASDDVAAAFARALDREVKAVETPRAAWRSALLELGFCEAAADAFVNMTAATADARFPDAAESVRGSTTLQMHVDRLVAASRRDDGAAA